MNSLLLLVGLSQWLLLATASANCVACYGDLFPVALDTLICNLATVCCAYPCFKGLATH